MPIEKSGIKKPSGRVQRKNPLVVPGETKSEFTNGDLIMFQLLITTCIVLLFSIHSSIAEIEARRAIPILQPEEPGTGINDLARFIAGIQPPAGTPLAHLASTPEWITFAAEMNARWHAFDTARLQPIRNWRSSAMNGIHPSTLFYPFSGPDFIYAKTLFPMAQQYILCGQVPVGEPPSMGKLEPLSQTLQGVQSSFKTLLDAGCFVTKDMRIDLKMKGTLPILCVMLTRDGDRIVSINHDTDHAEIHFLRAGDGHPSILYYFCVNLRNDGRGKGSSSFVSFINQSRPGAAYIKAASYLLHEHDFSATRELLLPLCPVIVQDDSGIPLRYFDPSHWNLRLFGTYTPPLDIFKKHYQPGLAKLYRKITTAPLGFGTGYHWDPRGANLVIYSRR